MFKDEETERKAARLALEAVERTRAGFESVAREAVERTKASGKAHERMMAFFESIMPERFISGERAILEELKRIREGLERYKTEREPPREIKGNVLEEFRQFCEVDLHLSDRTVHGHVGQIKRLLESVRKSPQEIAEDDIRNYLITFKDTAASTYANVLKSLRVFFRDFMRMDITNGFKFPKASIAPREIPTKDQLRKFYATLKGPRDRALFLLYATTGLRRNEAMALTLENIDFKKRMIPPPVESTRTKQRWITFFNEEAAEALKEYIAERKDLTPKSRLFPRGGYANLIFKRASRESGVNVSPQVLRDWFCSEMGELGVADRYVDAFCGRVPRSVLARHYTDFSPERLKRIYDGAGLRVLSYRYIFNIAKRFASSDLNEISRKGAVSHPSTFTFDYSNWNTGNDNSY